MSDEKRPVEGHEPEDEVEAQLLKEALGAGAAAAVIFAGSTQASTYPGPQPPGDADVAAELALLPDRGDVARSVQQVKPKAAKAKKAVKAKKTVKAKKSAKGAAGGGPVKSQ